MCLRQDLSYKIFAHKRRTYEAARTLGGESCPSPTFLQSWKPLCSNISYSFPQTLGIGKEIIFNLLSSILSLELSLLVDDERVSLPRCWAWAWALIIDGIDFVYLFTLQYSY